MTTQKAPAAKTPSPEDVLKAKQVAPTNVSSNPSPDLSAETTAGEADPNQKTLRGYVVRRPGVGAEGPSYLTVSGGFAWTWDKEQATRFSSKAEAKPLIQPKKTDDKGFTTQAAGPAANVGAKVVKFDEGADDE